MINITKFLRVKVGKKRVIKHNMSNCFRKEKKKKKGV